ncbi:MAG: Cys-tRNA(Pro) deacylase [Bacilli bacterium]|nr:Cys-tRNA(Pro) deacylase [Bacillota bacterium]MBR6821074.1 Cys-tRNA(Pro) deacylase [Bacilli bacterium]
MAKDLKTNAMRILEQKGISYKEHILDLKEAVDGVTCANMLGVNLDSTFKTLVTIGKSKNYYVFVIPVAETLSLKKAAASVGEKNVEMIPMKDLLKVAGYVHGGCSPIGMKKVFTTVIDETAVLFDNIIFSGGKIGYFIEVNPMEIDKVIPVSFVDIVED